MVLGSTQLLAEMSARNISGSKGLMARKPADLTDIFEPIVYKMWEPRHLKNLWDSTTFYRDNLNTMVKYNGVYIIVAVIRKRTPYMYSSHG
jgi:hypothetical protein